MGQFDIQQPVFQFGGPLPLLVQQKFLLGLFAQNAILEAVFIVGDFQLLDAGEYQGLEVAP